jgi:excisionase family DNA binding protein
VAENELLSLPAQIEQLDHALTAADLARVLSVDSVTIYKQAKAGRIPGCFRIGTCVRFDPKAVAAWLRSRL